VLSTKWKRTSGGSGPGRQAMKGGAGHLMAEGGRKGGYRSHEQPSSLAGRCKEDWRAGQVRREGPVYTEGWMPASLPPKKRDKCCAQHTRTEIKPAATPGQH
jgi:hypothetical protein